MSYTKIGIFSLASYPYRQAFLNSSFLAYKQSCLSAC
jgi:hypothetical protein